MSEGGRRGVTRGYVAGLIAATCAVAVALLVASWGMIALVSNSEPVMTESVAPAVGPLIVILAIVLLAASMWRQAITLLRGQWGPSWGKIVIAAVGGYLVWCVVGILAGMSLDETWVSPYALALGLSWALANLAFWAVLARRVYTDRPPPRWPWERKEESGGS